MENRFVTIASFQMPYEAEMAASILKDKGIPTMIRDNNTNPMSGGYVEIRLQVPEEHAERSLKILDEEMMDEGVDLLENIEEGYAIEEDPTASSWKDTDTPAVVCPRCLSINAHKTLPGPVPGWLNAFLLGLPGLFFPAQLQCRGCGAIFKR